MVRRESLLFDQGNYPTSQFFEFLRAIGVLGIDPQPIPYIDDVLQQRFFPKTADGRAVERWNLQSLPIPCSPNEFRRHLAACGFFLATEPEKPSYDRVAWPGGLAFRAGARLHDLYDPWKRGVRWKELVVFGGKRPLQEDKESVVACCDVVHPGAKHHHGEEAQQIWDRLSPNTELQMMQFVWEFAAVVFSGMGVFSEMWNVPIVYVDAPMKPPVTPDGEQQRPNTEDTIREWMRSSPAPGSMLISSGAPYGASQEIAFQALLEPAGHQIETFGHAAPELAPEVFMREVAGAVHRIRAVRGL